MTWEGFMRKRLNELHPKIFGPNEPDIVDAMTYFEYYRRLNLLGFGRDYTNHPRNPYAN
jgi:hypothetical protein